MKKNFSQITAVILAGGKGSRFIEETARIPKPLIEVNNTPILVHIMNHYSKFGVKNFIICAGYKSIKIKKFFFDFLNFSNDLEFSFSSKKISTIKNKKLNWNVKVIDTGVNTNTAGRLYKIRDLLNNQNPFFVTYGDSLCNVNIEKQMKEHKKNKKIGTITAVKSNQLYGLLKINENKNLSFIEKPQNDNEFINGGFYIFEKTIFKLINNSKLSLEESVIPSLIKMKQLSPFVHNDFWHPMDNMSQKISLEKILKSKKNI